MKIVKKLKSLEAKLRKVKVTLQFREAVDFLNVKGVGEGPESDAGRERCPAEKGRGNLEREEISDDSRSTLKVQERRDRMPDGERGRSFREMENVLPAFYPVKEEMNIDEWIEKIEIFEQLYGWDDVAKIHYAL